MFLRRGAVSFGLFPAGAKPCGKSKEMASHVNPSSVFTDSGATRSSMASMLSFKVVMLLLRMLNALAY